MLSSLADVIREEVRQAVQEPQTNAHTEAPLHCQPNMSYADFLLRGTPGHADVAATTPIQHPMYPSTLQPPPERRLGKSAIWRTPDRIPLCYHIARQDFVVSLNIPFEQQRRGGIGRQAPAFKQALQDAVHQAHALGKLESATCGGKAAVDADAKPPPSLTLNDDRLRNRCHGSDAFAPLDCAVGNGDWLLGEPRLGRRPLPVLRAPIRALVSAKEDVWAKALR
ncbi:hypothetical protein HPB52_008409 [Rhipicephalus sanguineus]|uniref:Uncharacterized protein n=1 Tax=Rhipicephalus sanguineus TaxID=34632 RepID=A0A9D4SNN1_RHISA|nr:hypothetical protein HPB52_008409 [Rhipicephalus sanguineus]